MTPRQQQLRLIKAASDESLSVLLALSLLYKELSKNEIFKFYSSLYQICKVTANYHKDNISEPDTRMDIELCIDKVIKREMKEILIVSNNGNNNI